MMHCGPAIGPSPAVRGFGGQLRAGSVPCSQTAVGSQKEGHQSCYLVPMKRVYLFAAAPEAARLSTVLAQIDTVIETKEHLVITMSRRKKNKNENQMQYFCFFMCECCHFIHICVFKLSCENMCIYRHIIKPHTRSSVGISMCVHEEILTVVLMNILFSFMIERVQE